MHESIIFDWHLLNAFRLFLLDLDIEKSDECDLKID